MEDDSSDEFMGEGDGEEINDDGKLVLVVRRTMSALAMEDLDQRENLFHNWCRVLEQLCFFIIDSRSCVNVASVSMVEQLKLPTRRHPKPYRLQWLNECDELKVTKRVLIKFKVGSYHDEVLCDVVPMQACHLLLGRPWEYDVGAKHNGRSNKYAFVKDGKKHILNPLSPFRVSEEYRKMEELKEKLEREKKERSKEVKNDNSREEKGEVESSSENELSQKKRGEQEKQKNQKREKMCMILQNQESMKELNIEDTTQVIFIKPKGYSLLSNNELTSLFLPSVVSSLLQDYEDLFSEEIPSGLPLLRGIEHEIDFLPGSQIPNKAAYRSNPQETKELQRQVEELVNKGLVRESLSPCAVPVILVPKKDGTWRMCVDCRAINKITALGQGPQAGSSTGPQGHYAPAIAGGIAQPRPTQPLPVESIPDMLVGEYEDDETMKLRIERAARAGGWSSEISRKRALEEAFGSLWV